jgi:hypothetical protein
MISYVLFCLGEKNFGGGGGRWVEADWLNSLKSAPYLVNVAESANCCMSSLLSGLLHSGQPTTCS